MAQGSRANVMDKDEAAEVIKSQLLEAAIAELKSGHADPGGEILARATSEAPADAISLADEGREKARIFDTVSGVSSDVLVGMLGHYMKKKRADGSKVFSLVPKVAVAAGHKMCLLHHKHPNREYYDSIGLAGQYCNSGDPTRPGKSNLTSEYQVRMHMLRKHKDQYAAISDAEASARELEGRLAFQQQTEALKALAGIGSATKAFDCDKCDRSFGTQGALNLHGKAHKDAE